MAVIYGMFKLILRFLVIFLLKQWQVILSYDVSSFVFFRTYVIVVCVLGVNVFLCSCLGFCRDSMGAEIFVS